MADYIPSERQFVDQEILLSHFIRQIESQHIRTVSQEPTMLHFDAKTGGLAEYGWPVDPVTEERILPSQLEAHRRSHEWRGPSCLCAFLEGKPYTEAEIGIVEVGGASDEGRKAVLNGEYVAICAKRRCGFFLCLERFYPLPDLMEEACDLRENPLPLDRLVHISDIGKSYRRGDGLFQIMPNIVARNHTNGLKSVHPKETKAVEAKVIADLMLGVSEDVFWDTFVQCLKCRLVQFREHYALNHGCNHNRHSHAISAARGHPYRRPLRREGNIHLHMSTVIGDTPASKPMCGLERRAGGTATPTRSGSSEGGYSSESVYAFTEVSSGYQSDFPEEFSSDFSLPSLSQLLSRAPQARSTVDGDGDESTIRQASNDQISESEDGPRMSSLSNDPFLADCWSGVVPDVGTPVPADDRSDGGDSERYAASSTGLKSEPVGETREPSEDPAAASSDSMGPPAERTSDMEKWDSPYDMVYDAIARINGPQ